MTQQLEEYYNRIQQCPSCPMSAWKDGKIEFGWGQEGKILFVGQSPAYSSFTRPAGDSAFDRSFLPLLMRAGITTNDFFFTNFCKFPTAGDLHSLSRDSRRHLATHLDAELALVDPVLIVGLGEVSAQWLLDLKFPEKLSLPHPSSIKYGYVTDTKYVQLLVTVRDRYHQLTKQS